MKDKLIQFFLKRHLLANMIFIAIFIGGILSWTQIPKEELPDVTFDNVRISVNYPGASSEEVEYYVTQPIEEALRDLDGIYSITSSTGIGTCSITAEIEKNYPDKDEVITEIRNEVLNVGLPDDIRDDPRVRVFKTSRKAIIDIGLFLEEENILNVESRQLLQSYVLALENKLLSLPEVSSISRSGYLDDEIHIKVDPQKLIEYNIPFNAISREINTNNVRQPAGSIENIKEPKVTLAGELNTIEEIKELGIQGGFDGNIVRLKDVASIEKGHEKTKSVTKINGREGIFLRVTKSSQIGIIDAIDAVKKYCEEFKRNNAQDGKINIVLLDDESFDVQNRLSLIALNGIIGFVLILFSLFIFLDFRSGVWVAMGIPFTFCFTLIAVLISGYSINNITLAAFIIVMGMVVDDAIVVSENITRLRFRGMKTKEAAARGTSFVFMPILASILTTCVAFIPLMFFSGHFGKMVTFIPPIIFFMLAGSFLEALFILPGHMMIPIENMFSFFSKTKTENSEIKAHWFDAFEDAYEKFIRTILSFKWIVFALFILLIIISGFIASKKMKFLMFPNEETREIRLTAQAPEGSQRYETARKSQSIENILSTYLGAEVVGFRNEIARTRRGSVSQENKFRMRVEILPKEKRAKSANQLIKEWEEKFKNVKDVTEIKFRKTWHGQSSGSPIEIVIKENNDELRYAVAEKLAEAMRSHPSLKNVEIDRPVLSPEYRIKLDRDKIRKFSISPSDIASTLRAALEGKTLYDFMGNDEEVYVRLTAIESAKESIEKVLNIPVENKGSYLVPLKSIVSVEELQRPDSIEREDLKRTTKVYADIKEGGKTTPLDIADNFEKNVFSKITSTHPSTIIEFSGEVKDTRESQKDFASAILMAIILIYIILALLFNSILKPFVIMLTIPFGVVGIILAFWIHGISQYGFFAVIGALGLSGVVINDAIIMLTKLESDFNTSAANEQKNTQIASIAKTRLRAVILTTITTVVGIIPTAYGWAGYDAMLAQMMLALSWGLVFGTLITLILIPCVFAALRSGPPKLGHIELV
ncbi:MAG: efflux RND transporter permease subunit [Candidatus Zapsychrus exili]|nr:efflux RND transporter permease subunit [Candidatus Zapsychrus exili]